MAYPQKVRNFYLGDQLKVQNVKTRQLLLLKELYFK